MKSPKLIKNKKQTAAFGDIKGSRYMLFIKKHGNNISACVPSLVMIHDEFDDGRGIDFFIVNDSCDGSLNNEDYLFNNYVDHSLD